MIKMIPLGALWLSLVALIFLASCHQPTTQRGRYVTVAAAVLPPEKPREIYINSAQGSAKIHDRRLSLLYRHTDRARLVIDLNSQTATLFHGSSPVIRTPVSTGKPGFETPRGTYQILEKKPRHRSSLYGNFVDPGQGNRLRQAIDRRKVEEPPDAEWKGAAMPYWQRLTWSGVGLHVGKVPGYPASHGCVRFPGRVMPMIYRATRIGTPVEIR